MNGEKKRSHETAEDQAEHLSKRTKCHDDLHGETSADGCVDQQDSATQEYSEASNATQCYSMEEDDNHDEMDDLEKALTRQTSKILPLSEALSQPQKVHLSLDNDNESSSCTITAEPNQLPAEVCNVVKQSDSHIQCPGPSNTSDSTQMHAPNRQQSVQKDALTIANMLQLPDSDDIYMRLLQKRKASNRMDLVMDEILEGGIEAIRNNITREEKEAKTIAESERLFADVQAIIAAVLAHDSTKSCDPNWIYSLLEGTSDEPNRIRIIVQKVLGPNVVIREELVTIPVTKCTGKDGPALPKGTEGDSAKGETKVHENSVPKLGTTTKERAEAGGNGLLHSDPIYQDMDHISKMFPDVDKNEIYAYLEAHFDRNNRIQIVTEELLGLNRDSQGSEKRARAPHDPDSQSYVDLTTDLAAVSADPVSSAIEKDVVAIVAVVPDCDPNFLYEKLEEMSHVADRVAQLTASLLEVKMYPKLKDRIDSEQKKSNRDRLQNLDMSVKDFMLMFPDPDTFFNDEDKPVSESYKSHAMIELRNEFPMLHVSYINKTFVKHQSHFAPCRRVLNKLAKEYNENRARAMRHKRYRMTLRDLEDMPDNADELFYRELYYARKEQEIKDYIQHQLNAKEERLRSAKEKGELHECGCCYDDECLFEDMSSCPDGHLFCQECIRRSAEENIGNAKINVPCLDGECKLEFCLTTLQGILNNKTFSLLLRKIQEEEIRQADIEGLEGCPFCNFATIIGNPDDKIFRCLSPECLKESCRLCKEPNHIPLRCDEVEKQGETSMRAFIENKITEAMVRTCWKCEKRFYKTEGCNKMTCTCGASMCYVCRKPIKDYNHFGRGGCPQDTDVAKLHQVEMEKAAKEAKDKYEEEHPELKGKELKYDPLKHLEELKTNVGGGDQYEYDEDEDEDEYDEEEYDREENDDGDEEFRRAVQQYMERNQYN